MTAAESTPLSQRQPLLGKAPAAPPRPGEVIAETYTILRLLGRGGMGDVYLASQPDGPDVALKMLSERWLEQPGAVARFEREATRLKSVEHPNVVAMLGSGVDRGRPYLVMEYVAGEPLSEFLERRGVLTLREFVPIAAQILKAMGHAHLREMMIRDVKPSNIMLCVRKGRANYVKLLDFGLAKFTTKEPQLTEGHVLGTAGYLAPEAIRGEALDVRVDVYALGVVFYQMLSGSLPFGKEQSATLLYKTLDEAPTPLVDVLPKDHEVPDAVIALVSDCLEKDREQRPSDANIIVERLIDAVPSSLFRLPTATLSPRTPGYGNSGLMELIRTNPSAQFPHRTEDPSEPPQGRSRAVRWAAAVGIAALASIATASALGSFSGTAVRLEGESLSLAPASLLPLDAAPPAEVPTETRPRPPRSRPTSTSPQTQPEPVSPPSVASAVAAPEPTKAKHRRSRRARKSEPPPPSTAEAPAVRKPEPVAPATDRPKPSPKPAPERPSVFLSADRDARATRDKRRPGLLSPD